MSEDFKIWEGIYSSFPDALPAAAGPGFAGDTYRDRSISAAQECLAALGAGKPIPQFHKQRSTLLPAVAGMLLEQADPLRILDFGGGLGIGYMTLRESVVRHSKSIEYTIVEVTEVCAAGRELLPASEVTYVDSLPVKGEFDLVHSASALQYIEDWAAVLRVMSGYGAQYILLSDVFAGAVPTFVTLQNYYTSRIRHWFLNLDELLEVFASAGYHLVMKSFVSSRRAGVSDALPMNNFPASHRLAQTLHLLLRRNS